MKLKNVVIHKYKSFETEQEFNLEDDITILVGMNESGKTSALEAIAKTNYFQDDDSFKFNSTHDYPRKELKVMGKSGSVPNAITCTYEIDSELMRLIEKDLGKDVFTERIFSLTTNYDNTNTIAGINADIKKFIEHKTKLLDISSATINDKLAKVNNVTDLKALQQEYTDEKYTKGIESLSLYFENKSGWDNPIEEYIYQKYVNPKKPKFLYYDEYFALPSRISIEKLKNNSLDDSEYKTANALFELADIDTDKLIQANNFEDFIAELEATEAIISNELFQWKNLLNLTPSRQSKLTPM